MSANADRVRSPSFNGSLLTLEEGLSLCSEWEIARALVLCGDRWSFDPAGLTKRQRSTLVRRVSQRLLPLRKAAARASASDINPHGVIAFPWVWYEPSSQSCFVRRVGSACLKLEDVKRVGIDLRMQMQRQGFLHPDDAASWACALGSNYGYASMAASSGMLATLSWRDALSVWVWMPCALPAEERGFFVGSLAWALTFQGFDGVRDEKADASALGNYAKEQTIGGWPRAFDAVLGERSFCRSVEQVMNKREWAFVLMSCMEVIAWMDERNSHGT